MFRFTIRDVLWLTVVIGMGLGWFDDHTQSKRLADLALTAAMAMNAEGWTVDFTKDHGPFFKTPDGKGSGSHTA